MNLSKYISISLICLLLSNCKTEKETKVSSDWTPKILKTFKENGTKSILPDYSYAGYNYGESALPNGDNLKTYKVEDFGAIANDEKDDTKAVQATINEAGKNGGGVVLFPKGRFLINSDTTKQDIIRINYSNLILRGSGKDKSGTIIFSGSETTTLHGESPWLSSFVFHSGLNLDTNQDMYSVSKEPIHSKITADVKKGDKIINLEHTKELKSGDIIIIAMKNTTDKGDLINELMSPLKFEEFQKSYTEAGKNKMPSFQWAVEIDEVINDTSIRIKQPARRAIKTQFEAFISKIEMLKNIGIENFRFESAYKGGDYAHHKTKIHDYGWGAICLQRVSHGWIKDITIDNYTQTTHLMNSRNVTISDVTITGGNGHYGPKMYSSSDNLVKNINLEADRTHGPGLEGASFGNIYKDIKQKNAIDIDLHGMGSSELCPPMYNLYENISMVKSIAGGGATFNIPHAGEYNTFWNIEMTGYEEKGFNELFYSWIWKNPKKFKNEFHIDCHKQYLRTIMVGIHHPEKTLSIENNTEDRADEWIYVEGLNKKTNMVSLYDTQLKMRLASKK
ncbi:uncharacterized protein DUF4955 [Lutibacter sp. Hel_I_33_5]|uniref:glycosyl hydrolase family 28-related protein n=1 Tax=Lutibacter sp. Hel_I_33_5 TaxID=1566289 RepID=UPI0011A2A3F2|nr:glycosyl hydrolase family 28-related protein [Lutibacter sp. Hel_I_33_5]TVZ56483.1 uncharacterized protein DUF4955 [Lutibacter sp. Hel_I_33_5]